MHSDSYKQYNESSKANASSLYSIYTVLILLINIYLSTINYMNYSGLISWILFQRSLILIAIDNVILKLLLGAIHHV
jgi:hypothetical protein